MDHLPVRKPLRMRGYDYTVPGTYFITICTQKMELRFGGIVDDGLQTNEAGEVVASEWIDNALRYDGIQLDCFVVMPNHLHGIVFLAANPSAIDGVSTLSRVVQSFKSSSTVKYIAGIKEGRYPPYDKVLWQRGFHDRILRNQHALESARTYIEGNPARWIQRVNNSP